MCCRLFVGVVRCVMFAVCRSLCLLCCVSVADRCWLYVVRCSLCVARCVLRAARCVLFIVCCVMFVA